MWRIALKRILLSTGLAVAAGSTLIGLYAAPPKDTASVTKAQRDVKRADAAVAEAKALVAAKQQLIERSQKAVDVAEAELAQATKLANEARQKSGHSAQQVKIVTERAQAQAASAEKLAEKLSSAKSALATAQLQRDQAAKRLEEATAAAKAKQAAAERVHKVEGVITEAEAALASAKKLAEAADAERTKMLAQIAQDEKELAVATKQVAIEKNRADDVVSSIDQISDEAVAVASREAKLSIERARRASDEATKAREALVAANQSVEQARKVLDAAQAEVMAKAEAARQALAAARDEQEQTDRVEAAVVKMNKAVKDATDLKGIDAPVAQALKEVVAAADKVSGRETERVNIRSREKAMLAKSAVQTAANAKAKFDGALQGFRSATAVATKAADLSKQLDARSAKAKLESDSIVKQMTELSTKLKSATQVQVASARQSEQQGRAAQQRLTAQIAVSKNRIAHADDAKAKAIAAAATRQKLLANARETLALAKQEFDRLPAVSNLTELAAQVKTAAAEIERSKAVLTAISVETTRAAKLLETVRSDLKAAEAALAMANVVEADLSAKVEAISKVVKQAKSLLTEAEAARDLAKKQLARREAEAKAAAELIKKPENEVKKDEPKKSKKG